MDTNRYPLTILGITGISLIWILVGIMLGLIISVMNPSNSFSSTQKQLDELKKDVNDLKTILELSEFMHNKDYELAKFTLDSAKKYDLDPILLTILINSESSYRKNVKHKLPQVKGLAGIHTKWWKMPINTPQEQIDAGAFVLKHYIDKSPNLQLALTRYKGRSNLGKKRANFVLVKYQKALNEIHS